MSRFHWRKSSFCSNDSCVELARLAAGRLGVRDTKRGTAGPVLQFSQQEMRALIEAIKQGRLIR
ncbi:DUF397 domain-containing protein [Actinomadura adrarensis]|uniref:DUF397 domain-containing protein n=1 Tax=Actinomadura adrarensis TaxID=1819600 RepID=A0ABW3CT37_9ACTN